MRPTLAVGTLALAALAGSARATAAPQGGFTKEEHPELGLEFKRPRSYEAVPTQPTDVETVLYYVEKERPRDPKAFRPELRFLRLEVPAAYRDRPRRSRAGPRPGTFEYFFKERLQKQMRVVERVELEPVALGPEGEALVFEYALTFRGGAAWARSFETRDGSTVLFGLCAAADGDDQRKVWRRVADSLELSEPVEADLGQLERYYARRDFSLPERRIAVRRQLVDGWKAEDTENYILVYSTRDEALIRILKAELEAIRRAYVERFPPAQEVTAVSTLRVCKDRAEYLKYGGAPQSGGYWNAAAGELVFYDYENVDGKMGSGKANSRIVLYHEAFHQYVYYAVGELAPHSWFNEGTGDYFSGARIRGGKVKSIGVNPWRVAFVQDVLERRREVPWADILRYEQAQFYRNADVCYAQAWSMIYFLRTSREVAKHPRWSTILDTYFETLKETYHWERDKLAQAEGATAEDLAAANGRAREAAVEKAFAGVDLYALETAWREYTLGLKVPKR